MNHSDWLRRTFAVLAVVACLLAVSGVAQAKFSATRSAGIQVGTAKMVAPTDLVGGYECRTGFFTEGITFTINSFTDAGPTGATYRYQVTKNGKPVGNPTTSTTRSGSVATPLIGVDVGSTTWTLSVQGVLGNWTSPVVTQPITCPFLVKTSGSFG